MATIKPEYIDVMLDLETLGVHPGCKILQLSACTFNLPPGTPRAFFDLHIDRYLQAGLIEDPNTLQWWMEQDAYVRETVFNPIHAAKLVDALQMFAVWLDSLDAKVRLWGNGVRFDNAILEYAYLSYDLTVPWEGKNERCFRTLKAIMGKSINEPQFNGYKHNALHDAIHQANYAELMLNSIEDIYNGE